MKLIGQITPHLSWSEARCKNGRDVPQSLFGNAARIALIAEIVRAKASARRGHDCPMQILSWYRDDAYNAACGGTPGSRHRDAAAIDFRMPAYGDQFAVHDLLNEMAASGEIPKNVGIGLYTRKNGWNHLDFRSTPARWTQKDLDTEERPEFEPDEIADASGEGG